MFFVFQSLVTFFFGKNFDTLNDCRSEYGTTKEVKRDLVSLLCHCGVSQLVKQEQGPLHSFFFCVCVKKKPKPGRAPREKDSASFTTDQHQASGWQFSEPLSVKSC